MLSYQAARGRILERLKVVASECVPVSEALGRACAEPVSARREVPAFDNSAMDGYALRACDTQGATPESGIALAVVGELPAGREPKGHLGPGEAMRIFTGAPVPSGADAVVMQEHTRIDAGKVVVLEEISSGQHVRRAGEDAAIGDALLMPGDTIEAAEAAMLIGQGQSLVRVYSQVRVAIVPTGDELVEVGEDLRPGQVTNTSSQLLAWQVGASGGVAHRFPIVGDCRHELAEVLAEAASRADLVLTTGGVSVGEHDLVREVLETLGQVNFWRVAVKPGKPLTLASINNTPVVGLPGNVGSTFVCFELFVRPALRFMAGHGRCLRPVVKVGLGDEVRPNAQRRWFLGAQLEYGQDGLVAIPLSKRGSGQLSSVMRINALLSIPAGEEPIAKGALVEALLLGDMWGQGGRSG